MEQSQKEGKLYTMDKDGTIRNNQGWPVGKYEWETGNAVWSEHPGLPPKDVSYAKKILEECHSIIVRLTLASQRQEEELDTSDQQAQQEDEIKEENSQEPSSY